MSDPALQDIAAEEARVIYRPRSRRAVKRLPAASRELARHFDGQRNLAEVCRQASISLTHGISIATRLAAAGTLVAVEPPAREPGFSEVEEAFFASEVQISDDPIEENAAPRHRWMGRIIERVRDRLEVGLLDSSPSLR